MKCPFCNYDDTQVIDTRLSDDKMIVKRRRKCMHCDRRFNTFEKIELQLPAVSNLFEAKFFYEQLGSWDCVRFGADSEIMGRVECLNNSGFVRWNNLGISMFCLDLDSGLTNHHQYGIDKVHGVSEPRKHYAASIRKWHQQVRLSQDGYLDFPSTTRRFDAPELGVVSLRDINYNLTYCYNQEYE
jgi:hypothetical protein